MKEAGMLEATDGTVYKSRVKVLMEFFRRSRDKWKQKCKAVRADLKRANNRSRWLETNRDRWKAKARELEAELCALREEQKAISP
jgi:hypothetical protein